MLDVDGTIVPYDYSLLPSDKLARAIKKAQEKVIICLVTGRSYPFLKPVLRKLGIHKGYAVINNGSHVINLETENALYEQPIDMLDTQKVIDLLHQKYIHFYVKQNLHDSSYSKGPFRKGQPLKTAYMIYTEETYSLEQMDELSHKLSKLSNLTIYKMRHKKGFGINISHVKATKFHGIEVVLKELGFSSKEVIAVGDGYNDFPLLMASGFKVAMGNAVDDLKAIADYVTSSVEEDGVVKVIEKFIVLDSKK